MQEVSAFESKLTKTRLFQIFKKSLSKRKFFVNNFSWYDFLKTFYFDWREGNINAHAASISYSFLMAMPPLLLFFFTLIPYFKIPDIEENIVSIINMIIPNPENSEMIISFVKDLLHKPKTGILSFSILITIYYASNGIYSILAIFDSFEGANLKERDFFVRQLKAFQLLLMMFVMTVLTLIVVFGQQNFFEWVVNQIQQDDTTASIWAYYSTIILLVILLFVSLGILYRFGPSIEQKWEFFNIGVYVSGICILLFTFVLFYLGDNFVNYNQVYGSIGSLFLVLVWILSVFRILLFGYTLNHSLDNISLNNEK